MTTQKHRAGAPFGETHSWHNIDWVSCKSEVRRLQTRIVKATQENRWNKVKALQWLLTHSFSAKALAVKQVTENHGKKTPGIDNIIWSTPETKSQATLSLSRMGYQPRPLRRVYIPKANGRKRPLGIPAMKDRAMQALYLMALEPIAETQADRTSFGFRPERSTADAIAQCFSVLAAGHAPQWILEGDIKSCFDNISHDWLLANTPMDRKILKKWLQAGYMEDRQWFPTQAGTPQGGIISPTLANIALDGLESRLTTVFGKRRQVDKNKICLKVNYVRYADDFIITGYSKELLQNEVMPVIRDFFVERGLTISPEKTRITHIDKGFDFLGQNVRKYGGKLLIKPSKTNVQSFLEKVRTTIKGNRAVKQETLIRQLNPVIKGWADFHRHVVAKATFSRIDSEIWKTLWQWARRRHLNKGRRWIKRRYFHCVNTRNWVFAENTGESLRNGAPKLLELRKAADTPIKRHRAIKLDANPFDVQWEKYFEERTAFQMIDSLRGRKRLIYLWERQDRCCPSCNQPITKTTGWDVHHIVRKVDGGTDNSKNLTMLHPHCHTQIHARDNKVVKLALATGLRGA